MKNLFVTLLAMMLLNCVTSSNKSDDVKHNVLNQSTMEAKTAIAIAEAVAVQFYGDDVLTQRPFKARLVENVWMVEGVLNPDKLGGVVHIELDAKNYCVTRMTHSK